MQRRGIVILAAMVVSCAGLGPAAKGCVVSQKASYASLVNPLIAGPLPQLTEVVSAGEAASADGERRTPQCRAGRAVAGYLYIRRPDCR
jgi:hypothetical protein